MDITGLTELGAQGAIVVLFGFTLTYLFKTVIPNMHKNFSSDLTRITETFTNSQLKFVGTSGKH